ncbi:MAG: DUF4328 domain-containing protein [Hyphomonadaceae bacterium]
MTDTASAALENAGHQPSPGFHIPHDFGPPRKSAFFLRAMLIVYAGVLVWAAWVDFKTVQFIIDASNGAYQNQMDYITDAEWIDEMAVSVDSSLRGQYLLCALAYLTFVYAAAGNLEEARAKGFNRSAEGSVGVSFIPIANFVLIFKVMRDIWVNSHDPVHGVERPNNILPFWWITFLIGGVGGGIIAIMTSRAVEAGDVDQAIGLARISIGTMIIGAISCALLFVIVTRIVRTQAAWRKIPDASKADTAILREKTQ